MGKPVGDVATEVLSLCAAVRQAEHLLRLTKQDLTELLRYTALAEQAAVVDAVEQEEMVSQVRSIRYILIERADGPVAAFLADTAARILGDGIGRLFS